MKRLRIVILSLAMLAWAQAAQAGKVGSTLSNYTLGGAGVGALLGTAAATIPYLSSNNAYDFYTGAGAGILAGAGLGFIFGIIDLATAAPEERIAPEARKEGLFLAWQGERSYLIYCARF